MESRTEQQREQNLSYLFKTENPCLCYFTYGLPHCPYIETDWISGNLASCVTIVIGYVTDPSGLSREALHRHTTWHTTTQ